MSFEIIRSVLAWCSVINIALLACWGFFFLAAHDWLYRIHGRWFPMPVEAFNAVHYGAMVLFKCGIILFNLVPYLACRIVG